MLLQTTSCGELYLKKIFLINYISLLKKLINFCFELISPGFGNLQYGTVAYCIFHPIDL